MGIGLADCTGQDRSAGYETFHYAERQTDADHGRHFDVQKNHRGLYVGGFGQSYVAVAGFVGTDAFHIQKIYGVRLPGNVVIGEQHATVVSR